MPRNTTRALTPLAFTSRTASLAWTSFSTVTGHRHANDGRIPAKIAEMEAELGGNNPYGGILPRLAQYELTLLDWAMS